MQYKPYTYKKVSRFYPVYHIFFEDTQLLELSGYTEASIRQHVAQLNGAWLCGYGAGVASSAGRQEYEKFKILLNLRDRLKQATKGENNED